MSVPLVAHAGQPLAPHNLWGAWSLEPSVMSGMVLGGWLYGRGLRRGEAGRRAVPAWRAASFLGSLLTVMVALLSPLGTLSGTLFDAHMFQHLLLVFGVAPLLVLGRPLLMTSLGVPPAPRRRLWAVRVAATPSHREAIGWAAFAVAAHSVTFWVWHLPGLYQAALRSEVVDVVARRRCSQAAWPCGGWRRTRGIAARTPRGCARAGCGRTSGAPRSHGNSCTGESEGGGHG